MTLNILDSAAVKIAGRYAHHSELLDNIALQILTLPTFKLLPIISCVWFTWFSQNKNPKAHFSAVCSIAGAMLALTIARIIQNFASERPRPMFSGNIDYVTPYGVDEKTLKDWSAFPSDHAALAFAISTGIFYFSRPLGFFCYFWSLFIVCMPRVYGGYHYATDIIVGAMIGMGSTLSLLLFKNVSKTITGYAEKLERTSQPIFYAGLFILGFQITTMFDHIRRPLGSLLSYLQ